MSVNKKGKVIEKWKCNYCSKAYVRQKTGTTSQMSRHFKTNHHSKSDSKGKKKKNFDRSAGIGLSIRASSY